MSENRAIRPVATLCRVLGVSPSGHYAWSKRALPQLRFISAALRGIAFTTGFVDTRLLEFSESTMQKKQPLPCWVRALQRQIQDQDIHARLAKDPEAAAGDVLPHQGVDFPPPGTPRACATRATCSVALAGLMSGSRPEPDVVTGSFERASFGCVRSNALRSADRRSANSLLVGPRFEAPELAAL